MATKRPRKTAATEPRDSDRLAVNQADDGYKVGPGHPPKEYQFQAGESGNPNGQPKHRTHLWTYFTQYMAMTAEERARIDRSKLTAAQETALKMVEKAIQGKGCGIERMARYIVDREEGKAAEHIIISEEDTLTDAECEELRRLILRQHGTD
jgi:hypothetical protein